MRSSDFHFQPVPAWLIADPCPAWCEESHPVREPREDQAHRIRPIRFPVAVTSEPPYLQPLPRGDTFVIDIRRFRGAHETWVYLGSETDSGSKCELTLESAVRLNQQLTRAIRCVCGPLYGTSRWGCEA